MQLTSDPSRLTLVPTLALAALASLARQGEPASRPSPEARRQALEWNDRGIAAKEAKKAREALEAFTKAVELDPTDPILARNLGAAWNDEGVRLLDGERDVKASVRAFEEARKRLPEDATVVRNLARAVDRRGHEQLGRKKFDDALRDFETALALDPSQGRYPTSIALVYYTREELDEAERRLEAIVQKFEKETDAWVLLGETCYKLGRLQRALEALERAFALAPGRAGLPERLEKLRAETQVEGSFIPQNSTHFQFHFPPNRRDVVPLANRVASILEDAYWKVGRVLECYPEGRTQVVFYEVKDFTAVTRADEWVGALYDGKIRVPIRDFERQSDSLGRTLHHEYTHRVLHAIAGSKVPTWLNEGIAQLMEEASVQAAEARLRAKPDKLLTATQLRGAFVGNADPQRAVVAYDQSLSLANYLVEQRGWSSLTRYLTALGRPAPDSVPEPKAFEDEFRVPFEEMLTRWRLSLGFDAER